ncbi:glycoside hydrolase family 10 protein [Kitasatospora nipponensis]
MPTSAPLPRRRLLAAGGAAALTGLDAAAHPARAATPTNDPATTAPPANDPATTAPPANDPVAPQLRAVWIATVRNLDWPSRPGLAPEQQQAELLALLDSAVERRLNAVMLQVRSLADALWPSPHEPWAACLTGVQGRDPGWDPLDFAVREAHRRDLELHAWFNPYRIALTPDPTELVPWHPARLHPEWVVRYGDSLLYDPGLPEVRGFVQDAMLDAVARYDVDGVHWDDYFYPYPISGRVFDDDAAFLRHGGGFTDRAAWRRDNVDRLVRGTAERIAGLNRAPVTGSGRPRRPVRFGISPFGIWRNRRSDPLGSDTSGTASYDDLYADTRGWVRNEWIDYVAPQLYWYLGQPGSDYAKLAPWWAEVVRGTRTRLYVGEALYQQSASAQSAAWRDPAELSRHLALTRDLPEVAGHLFFSARDVASDPTGAMRQVVTDHYPTRVRAPR